MCLSDIAITFIAGEFVAELETATVFWKSRFYRYFEYGDYILCHSDMDSWIIRFLSRRYFNDFPHTVHVINGILKHVKRLLKVDDDDFVAAGGKCWLSKPYKIRRNTSR